MHINDINYSPLEPGHALARLKKFVTNYQAVHSNNWPKFAAINNWEVEIPTADDIPPTLKGWGGRSGAKPDSLAIVADINGASQRIFTCFADLVIAVELPKLFPHILLNSMHNDGGAQLSFENSKRVSLEGDIDSYFHLYIDKDENVDALSIVTPDLMASLIDKNLKQDLEIYKNKLYFIAEVPTINAKTLKSAVESAQKPISEILHRAKSLQYVSANTYEPKILDKVPKVILTLSRKAKILILILGIPLIMLGIFIIIAARNFPS